MLKQATQLFIKALIIGLLINLFLQQIPATTPSTIEKVNQFENRHALEQSDRFTSSGPFE
jgi:hypothetical protein